VSADPRAPAPRAVILAAGLGSRLGLFTRRLPKPLLPVAGTAMLERSLQSLAAGGVRQATIVVGHLAQEIETRLGEEYAGVTLGYVRSDAYHSTNDIYSLWLAREHLAGDTLVLQPDVVYDRRVLDALAAAPGEANLIAVARHRPEFNGTVVSLDVNGRVAEMHYASDQGEGFNYRGTFKTMNIYLFRDTYLRESFIPELDRFVAREGRTDVCFEKVLAEPVLSARYAFHAVDCTDLPWYEVDTQEDRRVAERLLTPAADRLDAIAAEHGGFWRHDLTDHRLPSNPHFPTPDFLDELRLDLPELVRRYPVGQAPLTEIAASAFDVDPGALVIANGSSPLIKSLVGRQGWRIAAVVPSFNEYENATPPGKLVRFALPSDSFELDVEAFAASCRDGDVDLAVVVNPNNPTSLAVSADDLCWLAATLAECGCRLLVDESFVDFCHDPTAISIAKELRAHPNLIVLKSVSKVYGVGGIRLGYVLASDPALLARLRDDLPIWDVNGFAEHFLRLLPRFQPEFDESCRLVRLERDGLCNALAEIDGLHVFPAEANYAFVRLPEGASARTVTETLLLEHSVLAKDCGGKSMPDGDRFMRIASRSESENARFVAAFDDALRHPVLYEPVLVR
jgi:histidinol-phosphate/aromatic aminotransferase/cobyric acid decarboxylase-like protein/choline kinase